MAGHKTDIATAVEEKKALQLVAQPTVIRRCLACDLFFHSTGPDHRRCNLCKGIHEHRSIVG